MFIKLGMLNILNKKCKPLFNCQPRNFKHSCEITKWLLDRKGLKTHGDLSIVPLSSKYISPTWNLLNEVFFKEEPLCKFIGLSDSVDAKAELRHIFTWIMQDGISMVVTNKKTDEVVAANLNKIWVPDGYAFLKEYKQKCCHPASRTYLREVIDLDIFKICGVERIFEIFVGASSHHTRGTGLTKEMFLLSVTYADYLARIREQKTHSHTSICPEAVAAVLAPTSSRGRDSGLHRSVEVDTTVKFGMDEMLLKNIVAYFHLPLDSNK